MEQFKLMDNFKEEIVVKRNRTLDQILYGFCWISIVVFGLIALTSFYGIIGATGFNWVSLVIAVVFGALAFLLWRNKDKLRTEYEYSFTNGDLDISMVLGISPSLFDALAAQKRGSLRVGDRPQLQPLRFHARCEEAQLVFEPRREVVLLLFHQKLGETSHRDRAQR